MSFSFSCFGGFFLCCICCLIGTSCQKKEPKNISARQEIRLNLKNEPGTLDPRKGGDLISSHMHFLLFEGLVRLNPDGSIVPAQAESFTVSSDGKVYTFLMREALWSNGTIVTAYDFEKSWKDILDPAFPSVNAHLLYPIKNAEAANKGAVPLHEIGIEAKDAKTLVVTLETPTPYFLDLIAFCVFFPVNAQKDKECPEWAFNAGEHFVSNGPFILKEWKHNDQIIAVKNPLYWDSDRVRSDKVHFSMIANEATALQMFESGLLDAVGDPISPLPVDALCALEKKTKVIKQSTGASTIVVFNVDKAPFNNIKIRKAFAYSIDRESIVKSIVQVGGVPAVNIVPPVLKNNRNHPFFKDADLSLARNLFEEGMKELGITRELFKELTYYYYASDLNCKIAQALQQQWKSVLGVQIKIENTDHKILMNKLIKRDFVFAQSLWVAQYNDQMNILERFKFKTNAKNYANWENSDYVRLLEESFYFNGEKRAEILEKAEGIFLDEMPICPIYHWDMLYLVQPHLNDATITPMGELVFELLNIGHRKPI